jgi:hypothetical protein
MYRSSVREHETVMGAALDGASETRGVRVFGPTRLTSSPPTQRDGVVEKTIEVARSMQDAQDLDSVLERSKEDEVIAKPHHREAAQTPVLRIPELAIASDAWELREHRDGLLESRLEPQGERWVAPAKIDGTLLRLDDR